MYESMSEHIYAFMYACMHACVPSLLYVTVHIFAVTEQIWLPHLQI